MILLGNVNGRCCWREIIEPTQDGEHIRQASRANPWHIEQSLRSISGWQALVHRGAVIAADRPGLFAPTGKGTGRCGASSRGR